MEHTDLIGQDRRSFLTRAGVFAMAPLAANIAAAGDAAAAAPPANSTSTPRSTAWAPTA